MGGSARNRTATAARTIEVFSAHLRDEIDLDTLSRAVAVVDQTMEPTTASLWLRPPADRSWRPSPVDAYEPGAEVGRRERPSKLPAGGPSRPSPPRHVQGRARSQKMGGATDAGGFSGGHDGHPRSHTAGGAAHGHKRPATRDTCSCRAHARSDRGARRGRRRPCQESSRSTRARATLTYELETELAGILRAAEAAGFERFHLVGYSGGGAISTAFAARHPEQLLSLLARAGLGRRRRPGARAKRAGGVRPHPGAGRRS